MEILREFEELDIFSLIVAIAFAIANGTMSCSRHFVISFTLLFWFDYQYGRDLVYSVQFLVCTVVAQNAFTSVKFS